MDNSLSGRAGIGRLLARREVRRPLVWFRHAGLGDGDVVVAAYPKSGSTWLRFLLYEAVAGETAEFASVNRGIPGPHGKRHAITTPDGGRVYSSHELYRPRGVRVVYLVRDVRDVVLSAFRADLRGGYFKGEFERYLELFLQGRINYYGTWNRHVGFWVLSGRVPPHDLLLVRFERLRQDPAGTLDGVLRFLGFDRSPRAVEAAVASNSLENMRLKEDRAPPRIIRKVDPTRRFVGEGRVGGWRGTLTPDQLERLEADAGDALRRLGYTLKGT